MSQQFQHIPSLIKAEELVTIEELIGRARFVDGKITASLAAKDVKDNLQIDSDNTNVLKPLRAILMNALETSPYFNVAAQPKQVHPFLISKYTTGNHYGWHVDSPIMGDPPIRTDLAMTIFLSDPATYEGGELVIQGTAGPVAIKAAKGDAILYPCQFLHCVNEIKSGERLAAVTWIQSNIPSAEKRQLLFELNQVHALLSQRDPRSQEANLLLQCYSNLFRMWADV
ncbi:MAG: Fe2+-dependent dioxygenase [Chitinophagaceae bacterium]